MTAVGATIGILTPGGVAEWSNALVLKTRVRASGPRVRIPPPPPELQTARGQLPARMLGPLPLDTEQPLTGGRLTHGIVRVGATVRRPRHERYEYVEAVLRHLEARGFRGAPRFLGVDNQGREILTFIEGEVLDGSPEVIPEARLRSAASLIRDFHDATAGTTLASGSEVVCHGDLGQHNTVFRGDEAVALIDWDDGIAPGSRLVDFAHAVWCFAAVGELAVPTSYQAHAIGLMCEAYGWSEPGVVVDEIADRLRRARDEHARSDRPGAVAEFEKMIAAMTAVEPELRAQL